MSNELTTTTTGSELVNRHDWYRPDSIGEAYRVAQALVKSGLLPSSVRTPEAALVIIMTGAELGLTPMQSVRGIHIIDGKACLSADLIVGLVKRSSACEFFRLVESNGQHAAYETRRKGEPEATQMVFTAEQAKRAGLLNRRGPWQSYPEAMMRARCAAALARAVYPDVFVGIYEEDEAIDINPHAAGDVIPERVVEVQRSPYEVCAPWMRAAVEHLSALPGLGDKISAAFHAMGVHNFEILREHLERGLPLPKGVGAGKALSAYNGILEWYGEPKVDAIPVRPDAEPVVPEVIEVDAIDSVEVDYVSDPTQREYWTQIARGAQGPPILACAERAVELGVAPTAEAANAAAVASLRNTGKIDSIDAIGAFFAFLVNRKEQS